MAMSPEELKLYKDVHSKLTYMVTQKNDQDAALCLTKLKNDRDTVLQLFKDKRDCSWVSTLAHEEAIEVSSTTEHEGEWLNQRQMARWLGLDLEKKEDKDLLALELKRFQSRPHPSWPNQSEYKRVRMTDKEAVKAKESTVAQSYPEVSEKQPGKAKAKAQAPSRGSRPRVKSTGPTSAERLQGHWRKRWKIWRKDSSKLAKCAPT